MVRKKRDVERGVGSNKRERDACENEEKCE